jgi:tetratricopeptide (TPR) repeat protein
MRHLMVGRWPLVLLLFVLMLLLAACPPPTSVGSTAPNRSGKPTAATGDTTGRGTAVAAIGPTVTATPFDTPTPGPAATATPTPLSTPDNEEAAALRDEAQLLLFQSDLAGAEAKAIEAIAADSSYLPAHLQLAEVYLLWPHYWQQALAVAEAAVELAPDDPEAVAYLAWAQQNAHLFDDARANAERAAELGPDNATAQQVLADVLSSVYELDAAYDAAQRAVDLDRESAGSWGTLGAVAALLEYPDRAGSAYERAVDLEPDFFAWHILLARHELNQTGDVETALELAQPAIDVQPDHPFVLSFLVDVAIETNDWAGAEEACINLVGYNQPATPYPDGYSCLAGVRLFQEDNAGAKTFQELAEAIAIPQRRDITVMRMRLHNDDDECEASRALAEAWLEDRPYSVVALRMIGVSYLCDEDFAQAADYFGQALTKLPRSISDARLLANAFARDEKATEARAALNRVQSFAAENPLYYQALFEVHLFLGQTKEAIRAAQRWQVLRPESTDAMISLALGELFDNNPAAAQSHAASALEAGATRSTAYAILGETYSRAGDAERAEEYLQQALTINPEHYLARNFIMQLYLFSGQCDKAEPHIDWLKKEAVDDPEAVERYNSYLAICRDRTRSAAPDPATALEDNVVLTEVRATLRTVGVRVQTVEFAEDDSQRSLFVAYSSELAKDSAEFAGLEREVANELARLLPRMNSQPDGLLLLSGIDDEPQNIFFITTRAASRWVNGELSDAEFEETWLKESADMLREEQ